MQSPSEGERAAVELAESAGLGASFIARSGALDSPFVLVDVGVRGGIHHRWLPLEPAMQIYGFDAVAELRAPNERHHYFKLALGDYDGECMFELPDNLNEVRVSVAGTYKMPIVRLDTLWAKGILPPADFIKIDCENYEPEVLMGATAYLAAGDLLGADVETHFHVRPALPYSHFAAINPMLVDRRLRVADLAFGAAHDADKPWNETCNVLFTRHFLDERRAPRSGDNEASATTVLKTIAIFDVYGLVGPALALTREFRGVIGGRIDADALEKKLRLSPRAKPSKTDYPIWGWVSGHAPSDGWDAEKRTARPTT
jgi:FkbM family methyltransferase